jgi:uncharacterized protein YegL
MPICPVCRTERKPGRGPCPVCGIAPPPDAATLSAETTSLESEDATTDDYVSLLEFEETQAAVASRPALVPAAPTEVTVDVHPRLELPSVPAASDPMLHVLVDLTPHGASFLDPDTGPIAHVILLLDVSASMNHPEKYPVLTEALSGMLAELASPSSPDVLLSVVLFAYGAKTLFRDVSAKSLKPREVLAQIDASPLRFGRYTDIAGALKRAGRIAVDQLHAQKAMPTRIYILTDGKPQDLERTRDIVGKISRMPVDLEALAFGNDADVGLLQELVAGGRGGTVKQVRPDTLSDAFERIAEVATRIVSNRSIVEFELAPGIVANAAFRYRPGRHAFGEQAFVDGKFRTDLGNLEAGRTYSMLFEVRLPEASSDQTTIGTFSVRLRGVDVPRVFTQKIVIARTEEELTVAADPEVVAARDVLAALAGSDIPTQLRALRVRRKLYDAERRDPHVIAVIDKAIAALESEGSLAALSAAECATLRSHTCTAGGARPPAARREFAA